jgi:hypothetical protein
MFSPGAYGGAGSPFIAAILDEFGLPPSGLHQSGKGEKKKKKEETGRKP